MDRPNLRSIASAVADASAAALNASDLSPAELVDIRMRCLEVAAKAEPHGIIEAARYLERFVLAAVRTPRSSIQDPDASQARRQDPQSDEVAA